MNFFVSHKTFSKSFVTNEDLCGQNVLLSVHNYYRKIFGIADIHRRTMMHASHYTMQD